MNAVFEICGYQPTHIEDLAKASKWYQLGDIVDIRSIQPGFAKKDGNNLYVPQFDLTKFKVSRFIFMQNLPETGIDYYKSLLCDNQRSILDKSIIEKKRAWNIQLTAPQIIELQTVGYLNFDITAAQNSIFNKQFARLITTVELNGTA